MTICYQSTATTNYLPNTRNGPGSLEVVDFLGRDDGVATVATDDLGVTVDVAGKDVLIGVSHILRLDLEKVGGNVTGREGLLSLRGHFVFSRFFGGSEV